MLGSSMGATAALHFALERQAAGAVRSSHPTSTSTWPARFQGRSRTWRPCSAPMTSTSPRHFPVTREVRAQAETAPIGPRIAIQSMEDDHGVHDEQVIPFVERWRARGGRAVDCDYRPEGGHTSDFATADWFEHRIRWCLDERGG